MKHTERKYVGRHAKSTSMKPIEAIIASIDLSQFWKTKVAFAAACAMAVGGFTASHVKDDNINAINQAQSPIASRSIANDTVSRGFVRAPLTAVDPSAPSISDSTGNGKWSLGEDADEMKANLEAQAANWDAAKTELEALKSKISDAGNKKQADWTSSSWTSFQSALDTANKTAVINLDKGTAAGYKSAADNLQTAMDGLVKKPATQVAAGDAGDASGLGTTAPVGEMQQWFHDYLISNGYSEADFTAGVWIINHESGWNVHATNKSSGAYGLPQSLPGSKMASAGSDWQNNYQTQLKWFVSYCSGRYHGIQGAYAWWQVHHSY